MQAPDPEAQTLNPEACTQVECLMAMLGESSEVGLAGSLQRDEEGSEEELMEMNTEVSFRTPCKVPCAEP